MTMPDERMRSVRWGYELLQALADDEAVPTFVRERAAALIPDYPNAALLERLLREDRPSLQASMEAALAEAGKHFVDVRVAGTGSVQTRRDLVYVLRHFPDPGTIRLMGREGALQNWIELDDRHGT